MEKITNFDSLFTPFSIGKMEIKNRLIMAPMGTYAAAMDGSCSDTLARYFEERAKGGVGAIITSSQYLTPKVAQGIYGMYFDSKRIVPHLTGLTERIHCYGAKAIAQLSSGTGRNAHPSQCKGAPFSASAVPSVYNPNVLCRPLTIEEIKDIMKSWQLAAEIATAAGFDAIEVHGHVGYIIDQFLSPLWNKRKDEYGGSPENRARFAIEVLEAIKRGAGKDMPVIYRISMDHQIPGGRTLEDSIELLRILDDNGVDAFDVDCGCYEHEDLVYPTFYRGDACMQYVCETARKATDKPIMNAGNHTPETALKLVESGLADFAMFGRPLIADPYLPKKLMENRVEDVRPCIRCNEECIGRIWGRFSKLSCSVNPQANEENAFQIKKTEEPKNVVVIGGGPGGMEAARVCAIKGHKVTLYEREALGGTLNYAATAAFKNRLRALVDYYKVQMDKLGIEVINKEISIDDPVLAGCDRIIAATGAHPINPPIPGIDGANVIGIKDAHKNPAALKGKKVVVCGGGLSGSDLALELATEWDKDCAIVEMKDDIATDMVHINAGSLKNHLVQANVAIRTSCKVIAISEAGVTVINKDGEEELIPADVVVSAFGMARNTELTDELKKRYNKKLICVGDCVEVAKSGKAIRSGFFAGMQVE